MEKSIALLLGCLLCCSVALFACDTEDKESSPQQTSTENGAIFDIEFPDVDL